MSEPTKIVVLTLALSGIAAGLLVLDAFIAAA